MRDLNETDDTFGFSNDLSDQYRRVFGVLAYIMEFGILVCYLTIIIPFAVMFCLFLLALPAIYLIYAFQMPLLASIYMFVVYGGTAAYMVNRYLNENSRYGDDDVDGRSVYEDDFHIPTRSSIRDF